MSLAFCYMIHPMLAEVTQCRIYQERPSQPFSKHLSSQTSEVHVWFRILNIRSNVTCTLPRDSPNACRCNSKSDPWDLSKARHEVQRLRAKLRTKMVSTGKRPQVHRPLISCDCGAGVNINALLRRHAVGDVDVCHFSRAG